MQSEAEMRAKIAALKRVVELKKQQQEGGHPANYFSSRQYGSADRAGRGRGRTYGSVPQRSTRYVREGIERPAAQPPPPPSSQPSEPKPSSRSNKNLAWTRPGIDPSPAAPPSAPPAARAPTSWAAASSRIQSQRLRTMERRSKLLRNIINKVKGTGKTVIDKQKRGKEKEVLRLGGESYVKTTGKRSMKLTSATASTRPKTQREGGQPPSERVLMINGEQYVLDANKKTIRRLAAAPSWHKEGEGNLVKESEQRKDAVSRPESFVPTRVVIGGVTYKKNSKGSLERVSDGPSLASRRLSGLNLAAQRRKSLKAKAKNSQTCMFYNKFGKCKNGDSCPFIHDPSRVAVCPLFLRGQCTDKDCLFSHRVTQDKMPVCSFFLRGLCTNDSCPYRHVKVNQKAKICTAFLRGACREGKNCKKKHELPQHRRKNKGTESSLVTRTTSLKKRKTDYRDREEGDNGKRRKRDATTASSSRPGHGQSRKGEEELPAPGPGVPTETALEPAGSVDKPEEDDDHNGNKRASLERRLSDFLSLEGYDGLPDDTER